MSFADYVANAILAAQQTLAQNGIEPVGICVTLKPKDWTHFIASVPCYLWYSDQPREGGSVKFMGATVMRETPETRPGYAQSKAAV